MVNSKILTVIAIILFGILGYVAISANHDTHEEIRKTAQDAFHQHLVDTTRNENPATADSY